MVYSRKNKAKQTTAMVSQSPIVAVQRSAVPLDTPEFTLGNQALGYLFKAQEQPKGSGLRSHHLASGGIAPGRPLFQGLSQELPLQAKLTLTQAGDRHEHEADRVAVRVVQRLQTPTTASGSRIPSVMPKLLSVPSGNQGGAIAPPLETAIKQQQGKGNPIAEDIREPLEQAFGVDFSHVKIHTDGTSDQLNRSISALAFTTGKDIFFKQGVYRPRSPKGQALLAHELTHVVQQNQPLKTLQRKVDTPQKPQPAQAVEIIDLLPELSREIQAFSPNWLDSNPSEIELSPWLKVVKPSINIQQDSNHRNLDIQGEIQLNLGTDAIVIQPKGTLKLSYKSQTKQWNYESKNINISTTIGDIFKFDAQDITYDRTQRSFNIAQAGITIPDLNNADASVTKVKIDAQGLTWEKVNLNTKNISLGNYAKINNASAEIAGAAAQYKSQFKGDFAVTLGSSDLVEVQGDGQLTIDYDNGVWSCPQNNVTLSGAIADILKFNAKDIHYDHKAKIVTIQQSTVRVPNSDDPKNDYFKADVSQAKIDQTGLDWSTIKLNANNIPLLGNYVTLKQATGEIQGASKQYNSNFEGDFSVNFGSSDLVQVQGSGHLSFDYKNGKVTVGHKDVGLNGTIANILQFSAQNIHYDHKNPKVTIGQAGISIPSLNQANTSVENARINQDGIDWDVAKATIATIPIADIFTITNPAVLVEGRKQQYSTTASGGVKLKLGKYFTAEGKGAVTLAKKDAESTRKLRVDSLELSAKGNIQFPGDLMNWPLDLTFNYPIIPGAVEAGISLKVEGNLGASLSGTVKKESKEKDWNLAANPEIKGAIAIALKGNASAGTVYAAALNAFIEGGCKVEAKGGLNIDGKLGYDEESKKVDAKGLKSEYYAGAEFKITMGAGVQAKALYIFTKDLYAIRGELSLGRGSMNGNLEFDENGGIKIGKPTFEGCLSFKLDKKSIDFKRTYDLVNADKAKQLLEDAQRYIPGSGKERKRIIDHVKAEYINVFDQAKKVIENETSKNEKYVQKLERLSVKISRYQELLDLSGELFDKDQELVDLKSESKITPKIEKEVEEIEEKEQKKQEEVSDPKDGVWDTLKDTAKKAGKSVVKTFKKFGKAKEKVKEKFKKYIPSEVWDKYYALKEEKNEIKEKAKHAKDMLTIKLHDAEKKVAPIANIKTELKGKVSELKNKALQTKREMTEKVKSKALLKITEFGIQDPKSFIKRMEQLAQMQEKYTQKYEKHSEILENALKTKEQSDEILKNVKEAIGWDDEKLELGEGLNTISEMKNYQSDLESVEKELSKEIIKLDDNLDQELAKL